MAFRFLFPVILVFLVISGTAYALEYAPGRVLVKYRSSAEGEKLPGALRHYRRSGVILHHVPAGHGVDKTLADLRADPAVLYAEPDYMLEALAVPNDPLYGKLWGMDKIEMSAAWEITAGSRDIVVAVIDTGVDYGHPDLVQNIWTNTKEISGNGIDDDGNGFVDDVHGYDFANNDPDPMDTHGHGTHCAGTIGASGWNSIGVIGVSPKVKIMALKFLNPSGSTSDAIRAIEYAVENGARVLSNSWGGGAYSQALKDAIDMAGAHGVTFVAAAGNAGMNTDLSPNYPSCYASSSIISVGASDSTDAIAYFSNFGAKSVDVFAPGMYVLSSIPGAAYEYYSGTSMACPHVSGATALLLSGNSGLQPAVVRDIISSAVDPVAAMAGRCASGGRLNVRVSLFDVFVYPHITISGTELRGGDGDGFAESGETLDLFIELENQGALMSGAVVKLVDGGGLIEVVSGESAYPDTMPGGKSRNAEPFIIRVLPGDDLYRTGALAMEITSNGGDYARRLTVPFSAGRDCPVLLVDDDGGSIREEAMAASLESLGYRPAVWSTMERGLPPLRELRPYLVIWHTGGIEGMVLSPDEVALIQDYLALDGALVLTGSGWVGQMTGDTFLRDLGIAAVTSNIAAAAQAGLQWLDGTGYNIQHYQQEMDCLTAAADGILMASAVPTENRGTIVYREGTSAAGPSLAVSFDPSVIDGVSRSEFLHRAVRKLTRPAILSMVPRDGALELRWSNPYGSSMAELFLDDQNGNVSMFMLGISGTVTGLVNGNEYLARVRAVYDDIISEYSSGVKGVPEAAGGMPLLPAGNITITPSSGGLETAWVPSPDGRVRGYRVEVKSARGTIELAETENAFHVVARRYLETDEHGVLHVCPFDESGNTGVSVTATWDYHDIYPPGDAINVKVVEEGTRGLRFSWSHGGSDDLAGYKVEAGGVSGNYFNSVSLGLVNEATVENVSHGKVTLVRIRARDHAGNVSAGTVLRYGESGYDGSMNGCGCLNASRNENYNKASAAFIAVNHLLSMFILGLGLIVRNIKKTVRRVRPCGK